MPARGVSCAVAFSLVLCGSACASKSVRLERGLREYVATDYPRVLDRWTRSEMLFIASELDDMLTVTATFESWDFRWAYAVRYGEDYRLTVDQRRALLERSLSETDEAHQFYVALYAQRHPWSDLTADNAAWIIRLIDELGSETAPSEIVPIRKPGAIERTYFPYTTPWRRAYRVRFPVARPDGRPTIARNASWFGLRFAGAQGNQELIWTVETRGAVGSGPISSAPVGVNRL
jgi:hypothetical protein